MRSRSAVVESFQGSPIIGIADRGAGPEQLIERKCPVKNISAGQAEHLLQIKGTQDLTADDPCLEPPRVAIDGFDHQIGHRRAMIGPWSPGRPFGRTELVEAAYRVAH